MKEEIKSCHCGCDCAYECEIHKESVTCDTCETEMGEEGQQHFCGECEEELTEEACKDWYGLCERCAWRIKN